MAQLSMFLPNSSWTPPSEFPDLTSAKLISLDCETRDPHLLTHGPGGVRHDGEMVGVSIATDTGFVGYFPIAHKGGGNLDRGHVLDWLRSVLAGPQPKIGANLLYDLEWLRASGVQVNGPIRDIQIAEPLIDEEREGGFSLNNLAKLYLGQEKDESLLREAAKLQGFDPKSELWKMHSKYVGPYAEADAKLPLLIWEKQEKILKDQNLWDVFLLESELVPVLLDMRFKGVRIDLDKAETIKDQCLSDEARLLNDLREAAGRAIEPWSNQDIQVTFDKLGLWYPRTQAGNPSFTADWLASHEHPVAQKLVEFRKVNKMRRDFIEGICLNMQYSGRIHAQFHALRKDADGTRSGRFSSSSPNLQQIPARDEYWGPLVRSLFLPDEGHQWACLDYSQQEPRVLLHYAYLRRLRGSEEAVAQFNNNNATDFHQMVAEMAGISRKQAKVINLGMFYGMGVYKLAQQLDMEQQDARVLFEQYHSRVPFVRQLAHECTQAAAQRGQIRTLLGRVRHFNMFEPADSRNTWPNREAPLNRTAAEKVWEGRPLRRSMTHKALNALVQGSSADMMKKAMLLLYKEGIVGHITVHDELDLSVTDRAEAKRIAEVMETCVDLHVPLKVDVELGPNWGEIKGE